MLGTKRLLLLFTFLCYSLHAEIITDGSVGKQVILDAPDYRITQDLGKRVGDNLFHSFDSFNISKGESATFSGDNDISSVISRVTGGESSTIDGVFRNTIPNADTYFINPAGVLFGKNAQLDVKGSFHVSTADYSRLGKNDKFHANLSENSVLSVASPTAFGFLDNSVAPISIQGQGKISESEWKNYQPLLVLPEGKTLSFIGGDFEIKKGAFVKVNDEFNLPLLDISVPSGRINVVAVGSKGEVKLGTHFVDVSSFNQLSNITITENSQLSTDGNGGGGIFIYGKRFVANNSHISNATLGKGNAGQILINADSIFLNDSEIYSDTLNEGNAGQVLVTAKNMIIIKGGFIASGAMGNPDNSGGNAGKVTIKAKELFMSDYAGIYSETINQGNGGYILIHAEDISLTNNAGIYSDTRGKGNAGYILIDANDITLKDESRIYSDTSGEGNAGFISIHANDILLKDNSKISTESLSHLNNAGGAGQIVVKANRVKLTSESVITTSTENSGGGNINISNENVLYLKDGEITTSVKGGHGDGGNITFEPNFIVLDNGHILARAVEGHGGNINIHTAGIYIFPLKSSSSIDATSQFGISGEVDIQSPDCDISSNLIVLSANMLNAKEQLQPLCSTQKTENKSNFFVKPFVRISPTPNDWKYNILILLPKIDCC